MRVWGGGSWGQEHMCVIRMGRSTANKRGGWGGVWGWGCGGQLREGCGVWGVGVGVGGQLWEGCGGRPAEEVVAQGFKACRDSKHSFLE